MKRIMLLSASAVLFLTACGPSKEDYKKKIVQYCMDGAKKEMAGTQSTPEMEKMMSDYCNCAGDKTVNSLSKDELKSIDKDAAAINSPEIQKKLEPQIQPCLNDLMTKMQNSLQPGAAPMAP